MYETLNNSLKDNKIPRLLTEVKNNKARLCVYTHENKKRRPTIQIDISVAGNVGSSLETILSQLQLEAASHNIDKVRLFSTDIIFSYFTAQEFKQVATKLLNSLIIVITVPPKVVHDKAQKDYLLEKFHNDLIVGGHPGQKRLYSKLRKSYFWKNMSRDVAKFVKSCEKCLLNKVKIGNREPLLLTKTPQKPFDRIIVDTIGPLCTTEKGNKYAVTAICDLTKYVVVCAVPNKEAPTVSRALLTSVVLIYGVPLQIQSDLGSEYANSILSALTTLLKTEQSFSTPHHHETVGSIERNHRTFNEYLRINLPGSGPTWDEFLNYFVFTYNTTPNVSFNLRYSPYELVFSKAPRVLEVLEKCEIDPVYNIDDFAIEAKFRLQLAHVHAQELLQKAKVRNKRYYDQHAKPLQVQPGDKVLLTNDGRHKFDPVHLGPFLVERVEDLNVYIKDIKTQKSKVVHKNRIRTYNQ